MSWAIDNFSKHNKLSAVKEVTEERDGVQDKFAIILSLTMLIFLPVVTQKSK